MEPNKTDEPKKQESARQGNLRRPEFTPNSGLGGQKIPNFTVTRYELIQLVKHWERCYLDEDYFLYSVGVYSSQIKSRMQSYEDRIQEIEDIIGRELTLAATEEATEEFGASLDPRMWILYQNGGSLPPAVAEKCEAGKKVTEADWEASYKKPAEEDQN